MVAQSSEPGVHVKNARLKKEVQRHQNISSTNLGLVPFSQMSMNVRTLKQTSVTPMLNVATLKDSIYAAALADTRVMAERVKASLLYT